MSFGSVVAEGLAGVVDQGQFREGAPFGRRPELNRIFNFAQELVVRRRGRLHKRGRRRCAGGHRCCHRRHAACRGWNQVHELAAKNTDDQSRGRGNADPAPVDARRRQFRVRRFREPNHFRRVSELRETGEDLVTLRFERALVEVGIGLGAGSGTIHLEQAIVVRLPDVASAHAFPPSTPRNFRNALNRCTRTVAWLIPVAALISAGVLSSRWHSVNTSRCRSGSAATALVTCSHRSFASSRRSCDASPAAICSTGRPLSSSVEWLIHRCCRPRALRRSSAAFTRIRVNHTSNGKSLRYCSMCRNTLTKASCTASSASAASRKYWNAIRSARRCSCATNAPNRSRASSRWPCSTRPLISAASTEAGEGWDASSERGCCCAPRWALGCPAMSYGKTPAGVYNRRHEDQHQCSRVRAKCASVIDLAREPSVPSMVSMRQSGC